jgi:hypothetical protein
MTSLLIWIDGVICRQDSFTQPANMQQWIFPSQTQANYLYEASILNQGVNFVGSSSLRTSGSEGDTLISGSGTDSFISFAGKSSLGYSYFDGKGGVDTAIFQGASTQYTVSNQTFTDRTDMNYVRQVSGYLISDSVQSRNGNTQVTNCERLQFSDTNVALDTARGDNAGKAYRIYKAAFNRTPDTEGLGFWIKSLDNGNSLNNVSQGFIGSPEFQRTYGANSSDTTFLNNIYTNVLGRNYDQSGYDFWLNGLKNGLQRDSLLSQFSESVENCANVAPLIGQGITYKEYVG